MKQICLLHYLQTFTPKIYFLLFLVWQTQQAFAQLYDDFSDQDFTTNPTWTGHDSLFKVTDARLQLNAPAQSGVAYLSTASNAASAAAWEFSIMMDFNPSNSNYAKVYLTADQSVLTAPLSGYFLMIGGENDDVCLYQQLGETSLKIIDGTDGILDLTAVAITIRVIRDDQGWQLFTKADTTDIYKLEGTADDVSSLPSQYFGIVCAYTATRSNKFFFDTFNIEGSPQQDNTPPRLTKLDVRSSQEVTLTFSESLDATSATLTENFYVDHGVGSPASITLQENKNVIDISFTNHFPENTEVVLSISGVADVTGNTIQTIQETFTFISSAQANKKDIIITEILADPAPSVGLPAVEFVELYNRSSTSFNLSGWVLTDGSSIASLPDFTLLPAEYVVLTPHDGEFQGLKNVLQLANFPTLNNTADDLILKDGNGNVIDLVSYHLSWYQDDDKADGGYSLEMIDPNDICSEHENWSASENEKGGTPGFQNSLFASRPDQTGPKLLSAIPISSTEIHLFFNEKLDVQLPPTSTFVINPTMTITHASFADASLRSINLTLGDALSPRVHYVIGAEKIYDCSGNLIQSENMRVEFGLPEKADSLDVLFNEILFNPSPTGVDFVEIINASHKYINFNNWSIATLEDGVVKDKAPLTTADYLFAPGDILAITTDPDALKGEYVNAHEFNFFSVKNLPAFNDNEGFVVLLDSQNHIIDNLKYTKEMHSVFIKDDEGVSLERIATLPASAQQNWTSASSSAGFATPGYTNSAALLPTAADPTTIKVEPEIFNPLGASPNFALISYSVGHSGYVGNVKIFNSQGYLIKQIANNDILGTTGFYRWDGDRADGTKANVGYYMIWFEIFDEHGSVKQYQRRVAIAGAF